MTEELARDESSPRREVELAVLRETREVRDHEDLLVLVAAHEREDTVVVGGQELDVAAPEHVVAVAKRDDPSHPPEQRVRVRRLRLDVDSLEVELGVDDHRQVELLRIGAREARVAVRRPLHRRTDAVAVAEVHVVPHPDLVSVVEDGRSGQREQEAVQQLHLRPVVAEQRREPPADPEIDPRLPVVGIDAVHVVALLVRDHLERQLVVVSEEERPLARLRDRRRLLEDVDDWEAVLHLHGHEEARHDGEVERHMALVSLAEVLGCVLRPLVRLGEEHARVEATVDRGAELPQELVRLRQVLTHGALALVEVRNRVEPEPVDAEAQPEIERGQDRLPHRRAPEVEIRLVRVEPVPVVGLRHRLPRPVRGLEVLEDDARLAVPLGRVAPDVVVAPAAAGR